jgi:lipopolysaccharide biosynthesis glycosyltransferase
MDLKHALLAFIGIVVFLTAVMVASSKHSLHHDNFESRHIVHLALSADKSQWRAMLACINSTVVHCHAPNRLMFHIFYGDENEKRRLDDYATAQLSSARHLMRFVSFDHSSIANQFGRFSLSSSEARNLSTPHNFVRFYMSSLLPESVRKILWLDNDVLVLGDVAKLYDSTLVEHLNTKSNSSDEMKALATVVQRRALDKSMVRRIFLGLEVDFGVTTLFWYIFEY